MCNICNKKKETQNHIFRCNHPASRTAQITALKQIEKTGKKSGINTYLVRMLTKGIHAWMRNLPAPEISTKKHPVHVAVREAFHAQQEIGWDHALRGRLSVKWNEAQTLHTTLRGNPRDQGYLIVRMVWQAMDEIWKARNLMEHGTTAEERSLRKIAKMNQRLKKAYDEKYKLSQISRQQLFHISS